MGFHHRKLLGPPNIKKDDKNNAQSPEVIRVVSYSDPCFMNCPNACNKTLSPEPLCNDGDQSNSNRISPLLMPMFCILGVVFLLVCYLTFLKKYRSNMINSRRRNLPRFDDTHQDLIDENHGPAVVHPIWLINTVGLQQSDIDSITVLKYRKDEGVIEGTDCSVCLSEFEEDESLRLLPKCSHAFHIPCIDTWLRSHKNCPLCRAPVVCESGNAHVSTVDQNSDVSGSTEETHVESTENYDGLGSNQEGGTSEMRVGVDSFGAVPSESGTIAKVLEKNSRYFNTRSSEFRVLSDLSGNRAEVEQELQPVRRSVSMDSSSASMIYLAVANIHEVENGGCLETQIVQVKKPSTEMTVKKENKHSGMKRPWKSSSFRFALPNGPVSMKRSFSSSGKSSLHRNGRSQEQNIPL
ncbi:unnamed protein product [Ilex paraguariensis]|uniref:RING-type E3 ubiquitin transferase n=1 Tax=Ilex paraguariensis TaxID=185542 RepID=A0ABC8SW83_9AQUA